MKRKTFFKKILFLFVGGLAGSLFLNKCSPVKYVSYTIERNKIVIRKSELEGAQFALLNIPNLSFPIYLRYINDEQYVALLTRCTHRGCEVIPYYDRLSCPCHGSEYSYTGEVLSPPAQNPLMRFDVTTDREKIYILSMDIEG